MFKKIFFTMMFVFVAVFSYTACAEIPDNAPDNTGTYSLSLQNAIDMALMESADVECWEVNMKNYNIQLSSARMAQKDSKNVPVYVSQNFDLNFVKGGYYVAAAQSQIRLAKIEYSKITGQISYDVTQKYYTIKNTEKMCEIATSAHERAVQNLEITKKQYSMGACTEIDLKNSEIAVKESEANMKKCANGLEILYDSFKIVLGVAQNSELLLTDEIVIEDINADLEKDIQSALKTRYDINALKEARDLSVKYFEIASVLSEKSSTYFSAFTNTVTSKHNYETGVKNIGILIKSAHMAIDEAKTDTVIAKEKMELARKTYDVNKIRYEMGMITSVMLSASSDGLTSAQNAYESALLAEKLAIEKYKYEIQTGIM